MKYGFDDIVAISKDAVDKITGNMKRLIKEIKMLEAQLEFAEDASGKPHVCEFCGAKNAPDNTYCCKCGERL